MSLNGCLSERMSRCSSSSHRAGSLVYGSLDSCAKVVYDSGVPQKMPYKYWYGCEGSFCHPSTQGGFMRFLLSRSVAKGHHSLCRTYRSERCSQGSSFDMPNQGPVGLTLGRGCGVGTSHYCSGSTLPRHIRLGSSPMVSPPVWILRAL